MMIIIRIARVMINSNPNTILPSPAYFAPRLFVCVRFTLQTLATPPGTTSGQVLSQDLPTSREDMFLLAKIAQKTLQILSTAHTRLVTKHCDDHKSQSLSIHTDCDARIHPPYDSTKCQTNALFNMGAPLPKNNGSIVQVASISLHLSTRRTKRPIKRQINQGKTQSRSIWWVL